MKRLILQSGSSRAWLTVWLGCVLGFGWGEPASAQATTRQPAGPDAESGVPLSVWARQHLEAVTATPPPQGDGAQRQLETLRAMYFLSVESGNWNDRARDSVGVFRSAIQPETRAAVTLEAYAGALEVVRAKHSRWPPNKIKYLNAGAAILDDLVERYPDNLEVRYLRYASYRFLPFFLRRDESVSSDLDTLVRDLPSRPETFSPTVYDGVVRFILANSSLGAEDKSRLERTLVQ